MRPLTLSGFKSNVRLLPEPEASTVRSAYVDSFVNTSTPEFKQWIETLRDYDDGQCYEGYLWDHLRSFSPVSEEEVWDWMQRFEEVLVMWDLHSAEKIRIPEYWKFGRADVLAASPSTMRAGLEHLPEDLYFFPRSMEATGVLTHEYEKGVRVCLLE